MEDTWTLPVDNCNILSEAESLVMAKEHVIDHYGEIKWTIGSGCSGGSLVQQQVANAYPGLYQGITPQCSFTDAWSSSMEYEDYYMLLNYFETKDHPDADALPLIETRYKQQTLDIGATLPEDAQERPRVRSLPPALAERRERASTGGAPLGTDGGTT